MKSYFLKNSWTKFWRDQIENFTGLLFSFWWQNVDTFWHIVITFECIRFNQSCWLVNSNTSTTFFWQSITFTSENNQTTIKKNRLSELITEITDFSLLQVHISFRKVTSIKMKMMTIHWHQSWQQHAFNSFMWIWQMIAIHKDTFFWCM